jgi:hypothetical protein
MSMPMAEQNTPTVHCRLVILKDRDLPCGLK